MNWSPQQQAGIEAVEKWYTSENRKPVFRLFGYAGTGKTSMAKHISGMASYPFFAAFTGKAASVLSSKGCPNSSTIHSLIYRPQEKGTKKLYELRTKRREEKRKPNPNHDRIALLEREIDLEEKNLDRPMFQLKSESNLLEGDLLILDEVSMIGKQMADDLVEFGIPILALGDPGQLPPIKDVCPFTQGDPDVLLTEIHRQAENSDVLKLATAVRQGEELMVGQYGTSEVCQRGKYDIHHLAGFDQILVGKNTSRVFINTQIRRQVMKFTDPLPVEGDKLICLKNSKAGLMNGTLWRVKKRHEHDKQNQTLSLSIESEDDGQMKIVNVYEELFTGAEYIPRHRWGLAERFDFGYAITVHKAQGSEWGNVCVVDESSSFKNNQIRHLYTAITRASEKVLVIKQ